ncbi:MAG: formimidoylglutamase [Brumimicrobium sp.]|nr:formimidoylglutamase [Brumimicrobium sp.]
MRSKANIYSFRAFTEKDLNDLISAREGELKLGQDLGVVDKSKFVVIGIEESAGPQANKGNAGAEFAFQAFLSKFLNMQSNESLNGRNVSVAGKIVIEENLKMPLDFSQMVEELDAFLPEVLNNYLIPGQIPVIIGGGHNNAFPLIRFSAERFDKKINVVNLDAHADYRKTDHRHSGNPFSFAFEKGFMNSYHVLGLHERYNNQYILDSLRRDNHRFTFFEEYLDNKRIWEDDFKQLLLSQNLNTPSIPVGLELDLDSIENMPSSAFSPSGISLNTARKYIRTLALMRNVAYLHLPEGAPKNETEKNIVGKSLAYLVTDFISCYDFSEV